MLTAAMLLYALPNAIKTRHVQHWARSFFSSRDAIFRWNDPFPAIYQVGSLINFINLGKKLGINALQASTADIEWNGE